MSVAARQGLICSCCGAPRRPTQSPVHSFGNSQRSLVSVRDHRAIDSTNIEQSPSLCVHVGIWRNGGGLPPEHVCDDCILIGLREAKRFVDGSIAALSNGKGKV